MQNPDGRLPVPQISCKSLLTDYTARNASTHCTTERIAAHSYCASSRFRFDSTSPMVLSLACIPLQAANITAVQPYDLLAASGPLFCMTPEREAVKSFTPCRIGKRTAA
jgi:hypothetical protein